jgi:hypothetical protein
MTPGPLHVPSYWAGGSREESYGVVQGSVEHLSGLGEWASLGHNLKVWLVPPQEGEGLAEGCVVLHQHDPHDPSSAHDVSLQESTGR